MLLKQVLAITAQAPWPRLPLPADGVLRVQLSLQVPPHYINPSDRSPVDTQVSPLQLFTYAANTTVILTPKLHQDALNFILIHKTPSELRMKSCTHTRSTLRAADHSTTPKLPYFLVDSSSPKAPVGRPLMNQKCASPVTTNSSRDAETVSGG